MSDQLFFATHGYDGTPVTDDGRLIVATREDWGKTPVVGLIGLVPLSEAAEVIDRLIDVAGTVLLRDCGAWFVR